MSDASSQPYRLICYQVEIAIDSNKRALIISKSAPIEVIPTPADPIHEQPILVEEVGSVCDELIVEVCFGQVCCVLCLYV